MVEFRLKGPDPPVSERPFSVVWVARNGKTREEVHKMGALLKSVGMMDSEETLVHSRPGGRSDSVDVSVVGSTGNRLPTRSNCGASRTTVGRDPP